MLLLMLTLIIHSPRTGFQQMISLRKIQQFCQDTQLIEPRQSDLRQQCLEHWHLPDRSRTAPQRSEAKIKFIELTKGENYGELGDGGLCLSLFLFITIKSRSFIFFHLFIFYMQSLVYMIDLCVAYFCICGTSNGHVLPAEYMSRVPEDLTVGNLQEKLRSPYDYRYCLLAATRDGRKDRAFYLGEICPTLISITNVHITTWKGTRMIIHN